VAPKRTNAVIRVPVTAAAFAAAVEGLVQLNVKILEGRIPGRHRFPPLRRTRIVYKKERRDVWRDIQQVFESGWGDCEDLSAIVVAQLRFSGRDPDAYVDVYKSGRNRYHAVVIRGDGRKEDISRELGMRPDSPYGVLEGDDMQHDVDGEWDLEELGGEWDLDELGFDEDDYMGRGKRHGLKAMLQRRARFQKGRRDAYLEKGRKGELRRAYIEKGRKGELRRAYLAKKRRRAAKLVNFCVKNHDRRSLGHGAWVGMGDDPLAGDPNMTFDLYKSGRGWSGIVRIPTSLVKAGRRQAIIAKTSPTRRPSRRRFFTSKKTGKKVDLRASFARAKARRAAKRRQAVKARQRASGQRPPTRGQRAKSDAMDKAINLTAKIASLPGMSAIIPPEAVMAMKVLKGPVKDLAKGAGKALKKLKFW